MLRAENVIPYDTIPWPPKKCVVPTHAPCPTCQVCPTCGGPNIPWPPERDGNPVSADAKVYREGQIWRGVHDGDCQLPQGHEGDAYSLSLVLSKIEECLEPLAWSVRTYPRGQLGLVGYITE